MALNHANIRTICAEKRDEIHKLDEIHNCNDVIEEFVDRLSAVGILCDSIMAAHPHCLAPHARAHCPHSTRATFGVKCYGGGVRLPVLSGTTVGVG